MELIAMAATMIGGVFVVSIFEQDGRIEPAESVRLLTEEEIRRKHMLNACVLGAKFALRNNNPSGYRRASAEMRKYA